MSTLSSHLRNTLERTIVKARKIAETGAREALEALAIRHAKPYDHMSQEARDLHKSLRARAKQRAGRRDPQGARTIDHLVQECAYEHWHRMLFARFLAENELLIEPELGVAISLDECEALAKAQATDQWALASHFAQRMLPQVFRQDDPLLKVTFARNHRLPLEQLLDSLDPAVFSASDALGWVYQFWQSKQKEEVNKSGNKIGAEELSSVTQLFTEPYMVNFLIHNSLGAWYAGKVLAANPKLMMNAQSEDELRKAVALPGCTWDYLRLIRLSNSASSGEESNREPDLWMPAAGTFEGWPRKAAELRMLDPCCGSGHFLVAAFQHLVPLRVSEEELSVREACDAVLRENLHGLEIDERCTQIAAFALAMAAWTYPGAGGYRLLPALNLACSGIAGKKEDWIKFANGDLRLAGRMQRMHHLSAQAPLFGSLINPLRSAEANLHTGDFAQLHARIDEAMTKKNGEDHYEAGVAAQETAKALEMLSARYHWVITNVPYLMRAKQDGALKDFCENQHAEGKNDLATVFIQRCLEFCHEGGSASLVLPQNWLFLGSYTKLRERLLKEQTWHLLARLGPGAFEEISGEVVKAILAIFCRERPKLSQCLRGIEAADFKSAAQKAEQLRTGEVLTANQQAQLKNPDARVALIANEDTGLLQQCALAYQGLSTSDHPHFRRFFWEQPFPAKGWQHFQSTPDITAPYAGGEYIVHMEALDNALKEAEKQCSSGNAFEDARSASRSSGVYFRGTETWGKRAVVVGQMRKLPSSLSLGRPFDTNVAVVLPKDPAHLPAIWVYCSSPEYHEAVRNIDQALKVTNATLVKVPFDLERWQKVAAEKYPCGLPEPYSEDPTQWLFKGVVTPSTQPLQVAMARLLGYRWPEQVADDLDSFADDDGIVCIPAVSREEPAVERLRAVLAAAYGDKWSASKEAELVDATGSNVSNLEDWLRNVFFEQHCKFFHHRPFIWHIWDGRRRDGFHALVNYHKLAESNGKGRQRLETLTYAYLGDWIRRQKDGVKQEIGGAEDRLDAATTLRKRLIAILEGAPPSDIFVRWKPLTKQPIGWEPDINDGVRVNIRPFMAADISGGKKGAGILRCKPNIHWNKDKGKDPQSAPWFWKFEGDRINDHHLSLEEKRAARAEQAPVAQAGGGNN